MTRPAQCIAVLILLFIIGSLSYIIFLTPEPVQIFASHVPGHEGGGGSDPDPPEGDCGTGSSCSTGCSSGVCKDQDEPPANPPPGACDGSGNCKWTDPDSPWCSGGCCTGSSCPDDSGDDGGGGGGGGGGSSPTPSPTPAPAPTCTIDLVPASSTVIIDSSTPLVASFSASSGTINEVHFSSSDTGNVTVSPAADSDSPYGITASGASLGSATITATVHMTTTGHDHETACSDTATVEVTNPPGWWQTKDADVWSRGDLVSNIPSTYDGNGCDGRWFSCTGAGGYPGVLVYNGDVNFNWGGIGSSKGWLAESGYAGPSYSYSWFESKIPSSVTVSPITDSTISGGTLVSGAASTGYTYFKRTGDLTITSEANLNNKKAILFVTGNLTIQGRINLNDGDGFFMTIVGGNINVDDGVSHPNQPALEGAYFAGGSFVTGTGGSANDDQLYIRGSVVANGSINLQRDLGSDNQTKPGEFIEFAPDLIFTYPRELGSQNFIWREVAP